MEVDLCLGKADYSPLKNAMTYIYTTEDTIWARCLLVWGVMRFSVDSEIVKGGMFLTFHSQTSCGGRDASLYFDEECISLSAGEKRCGYF